MVARIHVLPSGLEFEVAVNQTILEAAQQQNFYWPTTCEGNATCTRCFFEVIDGEQNLSTMQNAEFEALENIRWRGDARTHERLACQTRIKGNITVQRRGVKSLAIEKESKS